MNLSVLKVPFIYANRSLSYTQVPFSIPPHPRPLHRPVLPYCSVCVRAYQRQRVCLCFMCVCVCVCVRGRVYEPARTQECKVFLYTNIYDLLLALLISRHAIPQTCGNSSALVRVGIEEVLIYPFVVLVSPPAVVHEVLPCIAWRQTYVHMHTFMCVCVRVCVVCVCVYMYIRTCIYKYILSQTNIYTNMCIHIRIRMYVH